MPPAVTFRPFHAADLPALQRIRAAAFAPVFASFRALVGAEIAALALAEAEAEQARHLDEICAEGSDHRVWIAETESGIAGFVSFTVDAARASGEIGLNAVDPDHAGRGIGSRLYGEALTKMKALGAAVATVGTGGDPSHAPARRAYEKVGFEAGIPSVHLYKRL